MKRTIFLTAFIFGIIAAYAQNLPGIITGDIPKTLKIPVDTTRNIEISTGETSVDVEGYDGDELIIEAVTNKFKTVVPPEAKGLEHIILDNRPAEDNSISYRLIADNKNLFQISVSTKCKYLHIKVPNNLYHFSITANNMSMGAYLSVKNLVGPFKADGMIRSIYISNVAGPFEVNGKGEKVVLSNILWKQHEIPGLSFPYNIVSSGDIDITFPEDMNANIAFFPAMYPRVLSGVYSDLNLTGTLGFFKLNDGGVHMFILNTNATNGNTYLRKQKK